MTYVLDDGKFLASVCVCLLFYWRGPPNMAISCCLNNIFCMFITVCLAYNTVGTWYVTQKQRESDFLFLLYSLTAASRLWKTKEFRRKVMANRHVMLRFKRASRQHPCSVICYGRGVPLLFNGLCQMANHHCTTLYKLHAQGFDVNLSWWICLWSYCVRGSLICYCLNLIQPWFLLYILYLGDALMSMTKCLLL